MARYDPARQVVNDHRVRAVTSVLDLVGPEGYVHGWVKVSGGEAAGLHHKQVIGRTSTGNEVKGTYDHTIKKVLFKGGAAEVTHVRRADQGAGMSNGYDFAAPKLGSGARFRKLSATLAARGASNPDALAAWIGRRKYGARKMARLSHHSHANQGLADILLAETGYGTDSAGQPHMRTDAGEHSSLLRCPNCGYRSDAAAFAEGASSASGTNFQSSPEDLRTPARGTASTSAGFDAQSAGINVRSGPGGAGLSNAVNLSAGNGVRRLPVTKADDIVVSRGADGRAVVRHRSGGTTIGTLRRDGTSWIAALDGSGDLQPRTQQRAALMDMLGTWNRSAVTPARPAMPLQQPPAQTPLMAKYGVENIRAFSTPATSSGMGPRVTLANGADSDGDSDGDLAGLTPRGRGIYAKLRKRGFPADRALSFAKRAQNFGGK